MGRNSDTVDVKLPMVQPDRCADCPLLGEIPKDERKKGSKETYVCLGTYDALSARGINVRKSVKDLDKHHPLRRWCDPFWDAWVSVPGQLFRMQRGIYTRYRMPVIQKQQIVIKFHS